MRLMHMRSLLLVLLFMKIESRRIFRKSAFTNFVPCVDSFLVSLYQYGSHPVGEENQYLVAFNTAYSAGTNITMEFDSVAFIELTEEAAQFSEVSALRQENTFIINYYKDGSVMFFLVKGIVNGVIPYFNSVKVNGIEYCETPVVGYLDNIVKDLRISRQVMSSLAEYNCGRRKVDLTEVTVNKESTVPGEWPWHVAIYMRKGSVNSYICGGTLISKLFVLTAAHCATINKVPVIPDILSVALGKYHLIDADVSSAEKEVLSVIIHEDFGSSQHLDNDIALLKLMTEAVFNDYIQPACVWSSDDYSLPTKKIIGTVAGWGYTQTDNNDMSSELKQVSLPMISKGNCINHNPTFYEPMLSNDKKFCAGWGNGTSPCNGDSGGGFMVHVPGASGTTGAWYIRGIVSNIKTTENKNCDSEQYVIFTDTSKYEIWIRIKTHENVKIPV